jgi:hypothetical protein
MLPNSHSGPILLLILTVGLSLGRHPLPLIRYLPLHPHTPDRKVKGGYRRLPKLSTDVRPACS